MRADSMLVRAYSQAKESQKALDKARALPDSTHARENALSFLVAFDNGYRTLVSREETTQMLHQHAFTQTILLQSTISTLNGTTGSSEGAEMINYLEGETNADLPEAYKEAYATLSRLTNLIGLHLGFHHDPDAVPDTR